MNKTTQSSKTTKSVKGFILSKLKKEYQIFLDKVFLEQSNGSKYYIKEGPISYSKTYIVPYSEVPKDLHIEVPLSLTTSNYRKRICFRYTFKQVDHKKKQLYFTCSGFFLENLLYASSTFEFNSDLNLKLKNLKMKSKVLFSKTQPRKCSKRIQKEVLSDLKEAIEKNEDCMEDFALAVLNKTFNKEIVESLKKNNEYVKAVVVTSAFA